MEERFFSSTDAAKITGCTLRQLQYWRQKGVVVPTVNTTGTGRNVYYSVSDLLQLTTMQYLLNVGLSFEVSQATLELLKNKDPAFFKQPLGYKAMKRFMLCQRKPKGKLDFLEFDEGMAISALRSGLAVIPCWTEILGKELEKGLQKFGSQLKLFDHREWKAAEGEGNYEVEPFWKQSQSEKIDESP